MPQTWRQRWHTLTAGTPGRRFKERYEAAQKARKRENWGHRLKRLLALALALVSFVIGVILVFIPGPAIVFFLLAGSLLSAESLVIARTLDWTELKLRVLWHWGGRHWKRLPGWGRMTVAGLAVSLGAAGVYASYQLIAG